MTHIARSGTVGSTFTLALAGVALNACRQIAQALKNRRAVRELHELDDRALKDIGLIRSDVVAALDGPLHLDPSRHLADVAGGTRGSEKPVPNVSPAELRRLRRNDQDVNSVTSSKLRTA